MARAASAAFVETRLGPLSVEDPKWLQGAGAGAGAGAGGEGAGAGAPGRIIDADLCAEARALSSRPQSPEGHAGCGGRGADAGLLWAQMLTSFVMEAQLAPFDEVLPRARDRPPRPPPAPCAPPDPPPPPPSY